jgi:hypothetical protein
VYCEVCSKKLKGRQKKFCGPLCKSRSDATVFQNYAAQQKRGRERKERFVADRGGGCEVCGYDKCLGALEFHHIDPANKLFNLDFRSISNRSQKLVEEEIKKCKLLCANCHREEHESLRVI